MIFLLPETAATKPALVTAVRNANRDAAKYTVEPFAGSRFLWLVKSTDGHSSYTVQVPTSLEPHGHCWCEFFAVNGCCKHAELVAEEARTWDMADAASADL